MKTNHKIFNVKSTPADGRIIKFLGTSAAEDRDEDIVTIDGWELDNYKNNPVFLWAHDYSSPPIGKAVNVQSTPEGLEFDIEFADAKTYEFADTIYKLYTGGFLNAVSVGFITKQARKNGDGKREIVLKELLELSAVPVPANPTALRRAYDEAMTKGVISETEYAALTKDISEPIAPALPEEPDMMKDILDTIDALSAKVDELTARLVTLENKSIDRDSVCDDDKKIYGDLLKSMSAVKGEQPTLNATDNDVKELLLSIEKLK